MRGFDNVKQQVIQHGKTGLGRPPKRFLSEHAKTGISPRDWCEAQGLNYSSAKRYIKVTSYGANSQKGNAKKKCEFAEA